MSFAKEWEQAKDKFHDITGEKKPKEKASIWNAFGAYTGLSGSLEKCDSVFATISKHLNKDDIKSAQGEIASLEKAHASYGNAYKKYLTVLKKAISDEKAKRTDKNDKSDYEKGLKFLAAKLEELDARIARDLAIKKMETDEATKNMSIVEKTLANWEKSMATALAKASTRVKLVKAEPTPKQYNDQITGNAGARDIRMQIVNGEKIKFNFKYDSEKLKQMLTPFESEKFGQDATSDQIITKLKEFWEVVKRVQFAIS